MIRLNHCSTSWSLYPGFQCPCQVICTEPSSFPYCFFAHFFTIVPQQPHTLLIHIVFWKFQQKKVFSGDTSCTNNCRKKANSLVRSQTQASATRKHEEKRCSQSCRLPWHSCSGQKGSWTLFCWNILSLVWKKLCTKVERISFESLSRIPLFRRGLEGTARYAGLLLAPAEGFGLRPRLFLPFGQKRAYYAVLAHFWQFLVSSSNLGNF